MTKPVTVSLSVSAATRILSILERDRRDALSEPGPLTATERAMLRSEAAELRELVRHIASQVAAQQAGR